MRGEARADPAIRMVYVLSREPGRLGPPKVPAGVHHMAPRGGHLNVPAAAGEWGGTNLLPARLNESYFCCAGRAASAGGVVTADCFSI